MITNQELLDILGDDLLTAKEIIEKGQLTSVSPINIGQRMSHLKEVVYEGKPRVYRKQEPLIFTGKVEKIKNILNIETNKGVIQYDFNSNSFISSLVPGKYYEGEENNIVIQFFVEDYFKNFRTIEWLYSYIDLLDNDINNWETREPINIDNCPKNFIPWIKENRLKINPFNIKIFSLFQEYSYVPIEIIKLVLYNYDYYNFIYTKGILKICNNLWSKRINIEKIFRNSIKKYDLDIKKQFFELMDLIEFFINGSIQYENFIDSNRTLRENIYTLAQIKKNKQNIILNKNLSQLNFLNNIIINDYIIIVPQNSEDLFIEGKQQNNCVGHYYNDNIMRNKDLIYFLRNKNNPDKSVITCRYNIDNRKTVEHKLKNNYRTTLEQEILIQEIDKIINEHLKL